VRHLFNGLTEISTVLFGTIEPEIADCCPEYYVIDAFFLDPRASLTYIEFVPNTTIQAAAQ
jgi:hypothetical protein